MSHWLCEECCSRYLLPRHEVLLSVERLRRCEQCGEKCMLSHIPRHEVTRAQKKHAAMRWLVGNAEGFVERFRP